MDAAWWIWQHTQTTYFYKCILLDSSTCGCNAVSHIYSVHIHHMISSTPYDCIDYIYSNSQIKWKHWSTFCWGSNSGQMVDNISWLLCSFLWLCSVDFLCLDFKKAIYISIIKFLISAHIIIFLIHQWSKYFCSLIAGRDNYKSCILGHINYLIQLSVIHAHNKTQNRITRLFCLRTAV